MQTSRLDFIQAFCIYNLLQSVVSYCFMKKRTQCLNTHRSLFKSHRKTVCKIIQFIRKSSVPTKENILKSLFKQAKVSSLAF